MKNAHVARILYEVADLLELDGVAFKPRAYRRAAQSIEGLATPIEALVESGEHREIPGVGEAIAEKIAEIVETDRLRYHDELKSRLPIDLYALTRIEGVGPKTAKRLYDELGIRDRVDLERAARDGQIRAVKGLGARTEEKILRGLAEAQRWEDRTLLGEALPLARRLIEELEAGGTFDRLAAAGSLRRGRETVGDLDIVGVSSRPAVAAAAFASLPGVAEVRMSGETRTSVRLAGGMQVDLRIVPAESFGAAWQYFTGSKAHNIALRARASARGWKLNEYGLFDAAGRRRAGADEDGIYEALGLSGIPPELREDDGEIQAAEAGRLPPLVRDDELRGDLHVHTDASDGRASLAEMARAASARGWSYIAITDHARFSDAVGGVTPDELRRQQTEIAAWNDRVGGGLRVLSGVEVNILPDGSLDLPDELLATLDIVVAAVHSHFRQDRDEMTSRLVRAVESPHVDILAHPTGRKIGERAGYDADWESVFAAAASAQTALEVNANPVRLDLDGGLVRRAIRAGARIAIGTDAHDPSHFDFAEFGLLTARRGWATASDILNTRPAQEIAG